MMRLDTGHTHTDGQSQTLTETPCKLCGQTSFNSRHTKYRKGGQPDQQSVDLRKQNGLAIKRDGYSGYSAVRQVAGVNGGGHQVALYDQLKHPPHQPVTMKKSDPGSRIAALKPVGKKPQAAKSPSLPRKPPSPDSLQASKPRSGSSTLQVTEDAAQPVSLSNEDLASLESRENGSGPGSDILDDLDGADGQGTVSSRERLALETLDTKIKKTMEQIEAEQAMKEANVNEYLKLATEADRQQLQRIKQVFEKKNQKSTQNLSQLQKKLENYHRRRQDVKTYGITGHKQAKEVLKDMGQGLKGVGANIVDGITGFSGGVVGNIKGAKDTIVSKPREFAHLIKNKFGSADNISAMKSAEDGTTEETDKPAGGGGGTLPARYLSTSAANLRFKYGSEGDNSSVTSGSGFGGHSSPHSASQNASNQLIISQTALDNFTQGLVEANENNRRLQEMLQRLTEEFQNFKMSHQQLSTDLSQIRGSIDEDKFKMEHLEEQMNDITELYQHEVTNLKQDITSMEEKLEYRLEERAADTHDLLENCQTRITKMELQQQQQQIISMEMVENVTFRTILTKLINVVLAILAVILVFVSTTANMVAPFLTSRARILSTTVLILCVVATWQNWAYMTDVFFRICEQCRYVFSRS